MAPWEESRDICDLFWGERTLGHTTQNLQKMNKVGESSCFREIQVCELIAIIYNLKLVSK